MLTKRDSANVEIQKALDIQKKLVEQYPDVPLYQYEVAYSQNYLGNLLELRGQREDARLAFQRSLGICSKLIARHPDVPRYHQGVGYNNLRLGLLLRDEGRVADSLVWFDRAVDHLRIVTDRGGQTHSTNANLLLSYTSRAEAHYRLGQDSEGAADWKIAFEMSKGDQIAWTHFQHGLQLYRVGKKQESEAAFDLACDLRERAAREAGPDAKTQQWLLARCVYDRGMTYYETNQPEKAAEWLTRAVQSLTAIESRWPGATASYKVYWGHYYRARSYLVLGKHEEAVKAWDKVVERCVMEELHLAHVRRAYSRAKAGMISEAVAEVADAFASQAVTIGAKPWSVERLYDGA